MRYTLTVHSTSKSTRRLMAVRVRDAQTDGHGCGRGLTELQGVTFGFWGGPQLHLWPQAARPLQPGCTESSWAAGRGL